MVFQEHLTVLHNRDQQHLDDKHAHATATKRMSTTDKQYGAHAPPGTECSSHKRVQGFHLRLLDLLWCVTPCSFALLSEVL